MQVHFVIDHWLDIELLDFQANNKWKWSKIFDASAGRSDDKPGCLAYGGDRIAVSYPNTGVKVWLFIKGSRLSRLCVDVPPDALVKRDMATAAVYTQAERNHTKVCRGRRGVDRWNYRWCAVSTALRNVKARNGLPC